MFADWEIIGASSNYDLQYDHDWKIFHDILIIVRKILLYVVNNLMS